MSLGKSHHSGDKHVLRDPVYVTRLRSTAEPPVQRDPLDVTYSLTICGRHDPHQTEDVVGEVTAYTTGLIIEPPPGCYLQILEHPLLHQTGYSIAGAPRIISPGNAEEVVIPLIKNKDVEDLEMPFEAAVMVLHVSHYPTIAEKKVPRTSTNKKNHHHEDYEMERPTPTAFTKAGPRRSTMF